MHIQTRCSECPQYVQNPQAVAIPDCVLDLQITFRIPRLCAGSTAIVQDPQAVCAKSPGCVQNPQALCAESPGCVQNIQAMCNILRQCAGSSGCVQHPQAVCEGSPGYLRRIPWMFVCVRDPQAVRGIHWLCALSQGSVQDP
jgi:hypothetical protein